MRECLRDHPASRSPASARRVPPVPVNQMEAGPDLRASNLLAGWMMVAARFFSSVAVRPLSPRSRSVAIAAVLGEAVLSEVALPSRDPS